MLRAVACLSPRSAHTRVCSRRSIRVSKAPTPISSRPASIARSVVVTTVSANLVVARGLQQLGTIDYNPVVPSLGPGRRPEDIDGRAGTSASILQYTSYGTATYRGLSLSVKRRLSRGVAAPRELRPLEDGGQQHRLPGSVHFTEQRRGPRSVRSDGPATRVHASDEQGPSISDQRHRFVLSGRVRRSRCRAGRRHCLDRIRSAVQYPRGIGSERRWGRRQLPGGSRSHEPGGSRDVRWPQCRQDADGGDGRSAGQPALAARRADLDRADVRSVQPAESREFHREQQRVRHRAVSRRAAAGLRSVSARRRSPAGPARREGRGSKVGV